MKISTLLLTLFVTASVNGQTITKKFALVKGQQLEQVSQVNMNLVQESMGQAMEVKAETIISSLIEIKDATPTSYSISNTVKRMVMNMGGIQEMKFDSDNKEDMEGEMGQSLKERIGVPTEFVINNDGIITEVKGKVKTGDPSGVSGMMESMFGQNIEEKEGDGFQALANIPVKGAKVGESWVDSVTEDGNKTYTTYTLKEVKGDEGLVTLSGNSNISKEVDQQGMSLQIMMQGTILGEYTFDVPTGIIKNRKQTTKATGTVDVMGQSVPMTVDTSVTSTITRKQ